jgi:hypothetical protein
MMIRGIAIVGVVVGATACVNAADEYRDFGTRLVDAAPEPEIDGAPVSSLPDVDGEWYLVAKLAGIAEKTLIHFRVTYDITTITENTGELDYSGVTLATDTLEPVGDPFVGENVPVDSDGTFEGVWDGVIPAEANPLTGSNVTVNGETHGQLVRDDFICGEFTGMAGSFPLAGTTWGAVRITGSELPAAVWSCED